MFLWLGCSFVLLAESRPVVLVYGDSLSAAYGIPLERGWAALLQDKMRAQGLPHKLVNASISGETTVGGLVRLPAVLERHQPDWLLLELGANDGLRALPLENLRRNLSAMIEQATKAGARTLLFEMMIPPNYGPVYSQAFTRSYAQVAAASGAELLPFFLLPIAGDEANFLADGIHPNAAVQPLLLEQVWAKLGPLLLSQTPSITETDDTP